MRLPTVVLVPLGFLLVAVAIGGSDSLPGRPLHHIAGGFRNLDPAFQRPSAWTRWSFIARRTWQSIRSPRAFDLPRVVNDGVALRAVPAPPSTFDMADEPLDEPPVRMLAEARRRDIDAARTWILKIGETRGW